MQRRNVPGIDYYVLIMKYHMFINESEMEGGGKKRDGLEMVQQRYKSVLQAHLSNRAHNLKHCMETSPYRLKKDSLMQS